jgi:hypothetical protein
MTETELIEEQGQVDQQVEEVLNALFGREQLQRFTLFKPLFLRIGLALHLPHQKVLEKAYPHKSPIWISPSFTSNQITALSSHIKISMPWENGTQACSHATVIPPHTALTSRD